MCVIEKETRMVRAGHPPSEQSRQSNDQGNATRKSNWDTYLRLGLDLGLHDINRACDAMRGCRADTTGNEVAVVEALQGSLDSCGGSRSSRAGIGGYYGRGR